MNISEVGDIFTSAEVARELGVTPGYVRHLARAGSLRSIETKTGQRIFLGSDVANLKAKRLRIERLDPL